MSYTWYVLPYKGLLDVKKRRTRLQPTVLEKLADKEDPKRNAWIALERGIRRDLLGNLGAREVVEERG